MHQINSQELVHQQMRMRCPADHTMPSDSQIRSKIHLLRRGAVCERMARRAAQLKIPPLLMSFAHARCKMHPAALAA